MLCSHNSITILLNTCCVLEAHHIELVLSDLVLLVNKVALRKLGKSAALRKRKMTLLLRTG